MRRLPTISPAGYRRITGAALVALVFIIVTGGAVRLTGSGLGCSDWPGCERDRFVASLELHPMVEFVNRMITGLVSVAVALAVLGSVKRAPRRRDLTLLSLGLVAGVLGQVLLGRLTVVFDLAPQLVMGHLLLSLVLIATALVLHHRAGEANAPAVPVVSERARLLARMLVPALSIAVVTGTVVTATGPHGGDEDARRFGFAIETVARVHSGAVIAFLVLVLAFLRQASRDRAPAGVVQRGRELLGVACAQAAVGWIQYFTDVPVLLVGIHILGASLVWLATWRVVLGCRVRGAEPSPGPNAPATAMAVAS